MSASNDASNGVFSVLCGKILLVVCSLHIRRAGQLRQLLLQLWMVPERVCPVFIVLS